ncbi:MAG: hypothetical protein ABMB14_08310 [Myxococcota bacterium]
MAWVWLVLTGCQQDVLATLGSITGVPAGEAPAEIPATPPQMGEPVSAPSATEEVAEPVAAEPAPEPPPAKFDPISVPQGPREGDGVKWDGVRQRGPGRTPPTGATNEKPMKL